MESSSKSRLVLAGILTAGVSSAVLYALHKSRQRPLHMVNQNEANELETELPVTNSDVQPKVGNVSTEDGSPTPTVDGSPTSPDDGNPASPEGRRPLSAEGVDLPTSPPDSVPRGKILYRGLEVSLSSSLLRAYVLARRVKSAGWSVVFWDGNDAHGDAKLHRIDDESTFLYGRFRFRSAQDLTTGRTFLLERCSSDVTMSSARRRLTVALRSPSSDSVPPVTEIFPLSVLRKVGICRDPAYLDEDSHDASTSGFISRKHNGKVIRYIKSYKKRNIDETEFVGDVGQSEVVRTFVPTDNARVRRLGSEFEELYHRMYDDYHAVVTPNTPLVVFHSHT